ncbi:hypothetical protein MUN78_05190 [Leucobacter allii]|uniref:Uncharacterized protein n=1 Tax=Leucobacter allii TaxID=2932247 RepID=A0ABY4FPN2_9MICO|nr:hypothetical protein [Leucobacter allii]UOQ58240.1 hypothetical protein MUN78_05190 [Leucobacter allii]
MTKRFSEEEVDQRETPELEDETAAPEETTRGPRRTRSTGCWRAPPEAPP